MLFMAFLFIITGFILCVYLIKTKMENKALPINKSLVLLTVICLVGGIAFCAMHVASVKEAERKQNSYWNQVYGNHNSSSTSKATCQYKNSDGTRTCTNPATHGQLCDYHFKLLDDTYNYMNGK